MTFRTMLGRGLVPLLLFALAGCKHDVEKRAEPTLPPLDAPTAVTALTTPGFGDPVVVLPLGITRPAPVLVAVIGIGDTPEDQCASWRELVGQRAFVLCPRGLPRFVQEDEDEAPKQAGFYHTDVAFLESEIMAGLAALKSRFRDHVADREVVYAGFSRGAFLGASLAAKDPRKYRRLVLIEGGQSPWTEMNAAAFARGGGGRVLFACGQPSCVDDADAAAALLRRQGVDTRVVHGQGEGHGYRREVKDEVRRAFDWVTEGDPVWRQLFAQK